MATEVVSTIRSSGGDYSSLSAWEAGEQKNLVSADEIAVAECYNDWPSGLNDVVSVSGWTADSTRYCKITVASGHRHNGIPLSGFHIRRGGDFSQPIRIDVINTRVEWVDVVYTGAAGNSYFIFGSGCTLFACIGRATISSSSVFQCNHSTTVAALCLAYSSPGSGFISSDFSNPTWLSCVAANCGTGFYASNAQARRPTGKNCIAYSNSVNFGSTGWNAASTHNATSTGSDDAPGEYSVIGVDSTDFVDAANNDFHLASGSALIGVGTNLYSTFATDVDGDTWPSSGAWDIGFDYFVSAGSAPSITALSAISITATSAQPRISYS